MKSLDALLIAPLILSAPCPAIATEYLNVAQAQHALFPQATQFVDSALSLSPAQQKAIQAKSGVEQRWKKQAIWRAEKDGAPLGWFIVDNVIGKHEFITYALALSPSGEVLGVEVMIYKETRGAEIRDQKWRKVFAGKTLADPLKLGKDVPNISGATLSCNNVTNGVRRLLVLHKLYLSHE